MVAFSVTRAKEALITLQQDSRAVRSDYKQAALYFSLINEVVKGCSELINEPDLTTTRLRSKVDAAEEALVTVKKLEGTLTLAVPPRIVVNLIAYRDFLRDVEIIE